MSEEHPARVIFEPRADGGGQLVEVNSHGRVVSRIDLDRAAKLRLLDQLKLYEHPERPPSDRNISTVLSAVIAVIPAEKTELRRRLEKIKQDAGFTAPEYMDIRWQQALDVITEAGGATHAWQHEVAEIFSGRGAPERRCGACDPAFNCFSGRSACRKAGHG